MTAKSSVLITGASIPSLPDGDLWTTYETARKVMIPNFSQVHAAERYRQAA
jgi:hypothetical protein